MKPRLIRLQYFVWLIVPVVGYLTYLFVGLPHVLIHWTTRIPNSLTSCTYVGPLGIFETYTKLDGSCQVVRFRKSVGVDQ